MGLQFTGSVLQLSVTCRLIYDINDAKHKRRNIMKSGTSQVRGERGSKSLYNGGLGAEEPQRSLWAETNRVARGVAKAVIS